MSSGGLGKHKDDSDTSDDDEIYLVPCKKTKRRTGANNFEFIDIKTLSVVPNCMPLTIQKVLNGTIIELSKITSEKKLFRITPLQDLGKKALVEMKETSEADVKPQVENFSVGSSNQCKGEEKYHTNEDFKEVQILEKQESPIIDLTIKDTSIKNEEVIAHPSKIKSEKKLATSNSSTPIKAETRINDTRLEDAKPSPGSIFRANGSNMPHSEDRKPNLQSSEIMNSSENCDISSSTGTGVSPRKSSNFEMPQPSTSKLIGLNTPDGTNLVQVIVHNHAQNKSSAEKKTPKKLSNNITAESDIIKLPGIGPISKKLLEGHNIKKVGDLKRKQRQLPKDAFLKWLMEDVRLSNSQALSCEGSLKHVNTKRKTRINDRSAQSQPSSKKSVPKTASKAHKQTLSNELKNRKMSQLLENNKVLFNSLPTPTNLTIDNSTVFGVSNNVSAIANRFPNDLSITPIDQRKLTENLSSLLTKSQLFVFPNGGLGSGINRGDN